MAQKFPFIVFLAVAIYSTRLFLFSKGIILNGELFTSTDYIFLLKQFLHAWGTYTTFGSSNIGLTTSYGLNFVFWILPAGHHLPLLAFFSVLELFFGAGTIKVIVFIAILSPMIGMYFFARYWFRSIQNTVLRNAMSTMSSLVYGISALMGDRISAGHIKYNFGHGVFPLILLTTLLAVEGNEKSRKKYILATGLLLGILIWLMPHLISLFIIMCFCYLVFCIRDAKEVVRLIKTGIISGCIAFLLNIHIWLPTLLYSEPLSYIANPEYLLPWVYFISRSIQFSIHFGLASAYERGIFAENYTHILLWKFLLPIFAFIGLIFEKDKRKALFLLFVGGLGLIFSMGINYPFEDVFTYLYEHLFLFKPFRDVGKFLILYLFSVSLLVPNVLTYYQGWFKKKNYVLVPLLAIFIYYMFYTNPNFASGNFYTIKPFTLPKKYTALNEFLSQDADDFRVAVYPNDSSIGGYDWFPEEYNPPAYHTIFEAVSPLSKNVANSNRVMWDWSSRYLDYLEQHLDASWVIERLANGGVKYFIIDHSLPNYKTIEKIFNNHTELHKLVGSLDEFSIYKINQFSKVIPKKQDAVYYFGDVYGMQYVPSDVALINLGIDKQKNPFDLLSQNYSNTIVLFNSSPDDLFYTLLRKYKFSFFPEIRFVKDTTKEFFVPAAYLQYRTQQGMVFYNPEIIQTDGPNSIEKKFNTVSGTYKVLLSTLSTEGQSNQIQLTINDQKIVKEGFRHKTNSVEWVDFGEVHIDRAESTIAIENQGAGTLYVDMLLLVPIDEFNSMHDEFAHMMQDKNIVTLDGPVTKEELALDTKDTITVLPNTFSPYWDLCDKEVFRVNFYAIGSKCGSDDTIKPYFKPEMLYRISLFAMIFVYGIILKALLARKK